jgi:hypothetical protein
MVRRLAWIQGNYPIGSLVLIINRLAWKTILPQSNGRQLAAVG